MDKVLASSKQNLKVVPGQVVICFLTQTGNGGTRVFAVLITVIGSVPTPPKKAKASRVGGCLPVGRGRDTSSPVLSCASLAKGFAPPQTEGSLVSSGVIFFSVLAYFFFIVSFSCFGLSDCFSEFNSLCGTGSPVGVFFASIFMALGRASLLELLFWFFQVFDFFFCSHTLEAFFSFLPTVISFFLGFVNVSCFLEQEQIFLGSLPSLWFLAGPHSEASSTSGSPEPASPPPAYSELVPRTVPLYREELLIYGDFQFKVVFTSSGITWTQLNLDGRVPELNLLSYWVNRVHQLEACYSSKATLIYKLKRQTNLYGMFASMGPKEPWGESLRVNHFMGHLYKLINSLAKGHTPASVLLASSPVLDCSVFGWASNQFTGLDAAPKYVLSKCFFSQAGWDSKETPSSYREFSQIPDCSMSFKLELTPGGLEWTFSGKSRGCLTPSQELGLASSYYLPKSVNSIFIYFYLYCVEHHGRSFYEPYLWVNESPVILKRLPLKPFGFSAFDARPA